VGKEAVGWGEKTGEGRGYKDECECGGARKPVRGRGVKTNANIEQGTLINEC
jgi:hypothetical protein